jgi:hypothetical protein
MTIAMRAAALRLSKCADKSSADTAKFTVQGDEREGEAVDLGAVFGKGILTYTLDRCKVLLSYRTVNE